MNAPFAAPLELRMPNPALHPPALPVSTDMCCKCRREVTAYVFVTDGYCNATYHCPTHGDVSPLRSQIVRPEKEAA